MNAPLRTLSIACLLSSLVALPTAADDGRSTDESARVRVIHASPDASAVDVLVNDSATLFSSALFGDVTPYADVPANVYDVKVVPAGAGPDAAVIQADLNLFYSTSYTVVAVGMLDDIRALVLVDEMSEPAADRARVRFVHASPDAPAVDVKVVDGPFLFQDVAFETTGDAVTVPAGDYDLQVRVAGTDTVALERSNVVLREGGVYTLLATGLLRNDSLDVSVVDDFEGDAPVEPVPRVPPRPLAGIDPQFVSSDDERRIR